VPSTYEVKALCKDGTVKDAEFSSALIQYNGAPAIMATARDISERKRVEQELAHYRYQLEQLVEERTHELKMANERLREEIVSHQITELALSESEERFRAIAETIPVPMLISSFPDGAILYVNEHLASMFGMTIGEGIGRNVQEFYDNLDDREAVLARVRRDGYLKDYELRVKRGDGRPMWMVLSVRPLTFQGKEALLSGFYDITRRKEMEETIRRQERYFRSMIEKAMDVIVVMNRDGTIRYETSSIKRVLGYEAGNLVGDVGLSFVHPEDARKAAQAFTRLVKGRRRTLSTEVRVRHADGGWRIAECVATNLLDDPAVEGIVVNFRDVTDRKRAQEKLQELYQQERELRERLETEMKRRVEFARALAHELKTPLTPVVISSEVLASKAEEEPIASLARNINRGAQHLNSRIDELLDIARGEIGMLELKPSPIDLIQLLRELVDDVMPLASSRGISLSSELPMTEYMVGGDRARLRQIVMNLLSNALKFTPEGGTVTLRAKREDGNVVVRVQDTGPGIAEGDQRRLFEPYQRLEEGTERTSGLGLGLALCKMLVELHGGRIWVDSRRGEGATFCFCIPVAGEAR